MRLPRWLRDRTPEEILEDQLAEIRALAPGVESIAWGEHDTNCWAVYVHLSGGESHNYAVSSEAEARAWARKLAREVRAVTGREVLREP